ncbi:ribosomal maturation YjgA family protein [Gemmatimonas sp.]
MSRRTGFLLAALLTMTTGLLVHRHGAGFGRTVQDISGDALWGMMIAWGMGALLPRVGTVARGMLAYGVCLATETSQLIRVPWLDAVRDSKLGHLVLGSDFDSRDLLAYAIGVLMTVALEQALTDSSIAEGTHP